MATVLRLRSISGPTLGESVPGSTVLRLASGTTGLSTISDATALGALTAAASDALFLLAANAAGTFARKVTLGATGRSLLAAGTSQAGRLTLGIANVSTSASNLTGDVYLGGVSNTEALNLSFWNSAAGTYDALTLDDTGWFFPRGASFAGTVQAIEFAGTASGLSGMPVSGLDQSGATANQVLAWGGSEWQPTTIATGVPTAITVANEASDTTCFLLFGTAATGNLGPKTNNALQFNSATGALAALTVSGVSVLSGGAYSMTAGGNYQTTRYGRSAATSVTGGSGPNTVIGEEAGASLTTGVHNTLIGLQAGNGLTSGGDNTVVGSQIGLGSGASTAVIVGRFSSAASVVNATAVGQGCSVNHNFGVCLGSNANTFKDNQAVFGNYTDALSFQSLSSTSTNRMVCELQRGWLDSTDAVRTGWLALCAYHTTSAQEGVRVSANSGGCNVSLFGVGSFGGGNNVTFVKNAATVPTSNPTGGGIIYVESGALKYRGSSGTITTLGAA